MLTGAQGIYTASSWEQRWTGALSANIYFVPPTVVGTGMSAGGTIHRRLMQMGSSVGSPVPPPVPAPTPVP